MAWPVLDAIDDGGKEIVFERGIALFDSSWTPVYRKLVPMPVQVDKGGVEAGTLAIDERALQVLPGRYYLGTSDQSSRIRASGRIYAGTRGGGLRGSWTQDKRYRACGKGGRGLFGY